MAKNWERNLQRELKNAAIKEFDNWTTQDFIAHVLELREQISGLEMQLSAGDKNSHQKAQKEPLTESKYDLDWSFPTKIHFLLALHQRPLTSEDLDGFLSKLDSQYRDYKHPRNNLTTSISRAVKSGRIKKIKEPGIKLKYYALPEWVDKEGQLRAPYVIPSFFE